MRKETLFKPLSMVLAIALLPLLLWMSTGAGISGDEFLHLDHAEDVIDYFISSGANQEALNTPVTNLKHYGQSFDNLVSLIARVFNIEDIFLTRHLASAAAGWTIIMVAGLVARKTGGWATAFFTILILAVSPGFIGHSLNNLKDIPFALSYIAGIYLVCNWINDWPRPRLKTAWWLVAVIAFAISIRPPGLILIAYLGLAVTLISTVRYFKGETGIKTILLAGSKTLLVMLAGYFAGLLFWPYALQNPLVNPFLSHQLMVEYPVTIRQLFMGQMVWSDMLPWYYLTWMIFINVPLIVIPGLIAFAAIYKFKHLSKSTIILLFSVLFPLVYIIINQSNVYGGWRHVLFIYPPLAIIAGHGLMLLYNLIKSRLTKVFQLGLAVVAVLLAAEPVAFMIREHPFHYLYFNPLIGGYKGAFGKYEADYYFNTITPAAVWLNNHIVQTGEKQVKIVSGFESAWHFRNNPGIASVSQASWYNRNRHDWDYAIFSATYLHAHTLKNGAWPPPGTIHTIMVDGMPACVVIKRTTRKDFIGWEELKQGNFDNAIEYLRKSVEADPSIEGAWLDLGRALFQVGKYKEAIVKLNRALAIHPLFEPALLEKARCKIEIGDMAQALSITNLLLSSNPKYLPGFLLKSEILVQEGEMKGAAETLREALTIQPNFCNARTRLLELTENR